MSDTGDPAGLPKSKSEPAILDDATAAEIGKTTTNTSSEDATTGEGLTPQMSSSPSLSPSLLSRNPSFTNSAAYMEDEEAFPPLDKLSVFDFLDNLALPQRIEKWQSTIAAQTEKVRRQREKLARGFQGLNAKDRAVAEWRKRVPTADEQLERYKKRMRDSVDNLGRRWQDTAAVTAREKMSFIAGVLNVFISGYLIGGAPEHFYYWFTAQLCYFFPLRYFTYHRKGYHYFLFDLCYFVNFLTILSIWAFPQSKRLFISSYCLAYGNNAVAIAMWRNSMVFHSLDKVISLFIHIMPPVTLHCLVHLTPAPFLSHRFPAIYNIKYSSPDSPEHYSLASMIIWSTIPYTIWQLTYHLLITVRRRDKIASGARPTSFTWLRKSYSKTWIGKLVLSLPTSLQEPAFMLIQYSYALLTMLPCPLWFWYRWWSAAFLLSVFGWSVYNGATYYIDVFGKRFQRELEMVKRDVNKWQASSESVALGVGSGVAASSPDVAAAGKRDPMTLVDGDGDGDTTGGGGRRENGSPAEERKKSRDVDVDVGGDNEPDARRDETNTTTGSQRQQTNDPAEPRERRNRATRPSEGEGGEDDGRGGGGL